MRRGRGWNSVVDARRVWMGTTMACTAAVCGFAAGLSTGEFTEELIRGKIEFLSGGGKGSALYRDLQLASTVRRSPPS